MMKIIKCENDIINNTNHYHHHHHHQQTNNNNGNLQHFTTATIHNPFIGFMHQSVQLKIETHAFIISQLIMTDCDDINSATRELRGQQTKQNTKQKQTKATHFY